jgi:hypothetical protein
MRNRYSIASRAKAPFVGMVPVILTSFNYV